MRPVGMGLGAGRLVRGPAGDPARYAPGATSSCCAAGERGAYTISSIFGGLGMRTLMIAAAEVWASNPSALTVATLEMASPCAAVNFAPASAGSAGRRSVRKAMLAARAMPRRLPSLGGWQGVTGGRPVALD